MLHLPALHEPRPTHVSGNKGARTRRVRNSPTCRTVAIALDGGRAHFDGGQRVRVVNRVSFRSPTVRRTSLVTFRIDRCRSIPNYTGGPSIGLASEAN
jgi:hypothetical protein